MLTSEERRAALFLAAIAALGGAVRIIRAPAQAPPQAVAPHLQGGDVQRQAALARREAELLRPLGPGDTIDVDRASARELERLPGVGPALARRIVADREARGPFGSLEALDQVPGVGPRVLTDIRAHARFSGPRRVIPEPQDSQKLGASRSRAVRRVRRGAAAP